MTARARWAIACWATFGVLSLVLVAGTAFAGVSAAVPPIGTHTLLPPWDLDLGLSSATVTLVLIAAYVLGTLCVAAGLLAGRLIGTGLVPLSPRVILLGGAVAVLICVLVPPLGSADHLSYTAYGRIAAQGGDPYVGAPVAWAGGADPITSAVQPPWQQTPSVYGPVATALQALAALAGHGALRPTVWCWQLIAAAAFGLTALVLDRLTRHDPAARTRAAMLWTLNPLLLAELVLGAHVDVVAVAFAVAAIALAARRPLPAGLMLGAAVGTKITFGLFGLAICWGLWAAYRHGLPRATALRHAGFGVLGSLIVLVPAHLWSGPHTYDQLRQATRFISYATSWRLFADRYDSVIGADTVRAIAGPAALVLGALLAWLLATRMRGLPASLRSDPGPDARDRVTDSAVRAAVVLAAAWVLTAPYALPWYDAMLWAPLALLTPTVLDAAALARLGVLALAYVPGRVVGLSPDVERLTIDFRREFAPWLALAVTVLVVGYAVTRRRLGTPVTRAAGPQAGSADRDRSAAAD